MESNACAMTTVKQAESLSKLKSLKVSWSGEHRHALVYLESFSGLKTEMTIAQHHAVLHPLTSIHMFRLGKQVLLRRIPTTRNLYHGMGS